ncbi:MAG: ABC transporter ATP-binding protein [Alkalispirochaetaceae bacterium]
MIAFEKVTKRYGSITAVSELTLSIADGDVCALVGPSGCGKSTTLKMINRLLEPTSGSIRVWEKPVESFATEELRRRIGYVIQSVGLLPHMRVRENIGIVPRLLGWNEKKRDQRAEELLEMVGLDPMEYGEKYPSELSGGEAQRVGVARALAADPPLLLMDEPFGAVDPLNRQVLQQAFLEIQNRLKKTVVFVTHDLDEAIRLGDTVAIMNQGRLLQHAPPQELLLHPTDSFVEEFVGADRLLRRLNTITVREVRSLLEVKSEKPAKEDNPRIAYDMTLREALALFLSSGMGELSVANGEGPSHTMRFSDILTLARSATGGATTGRET